MAVRVVAVSPADTGGDSPANPAPSLNRADYVRVEASDRIHVVEVGARLTLCADFSSKDAKVIDSGAVKLNQVCGHCAEHRMDILDAQGKIERGWHTS